MNEKIVGAIGAGLVGAAAGAHTVSQSNAANSVRARESIPHALAQVKRTGNIVDTVEDLRQDNITKANLEDMIVQSEYAGCVTVEDNSFPLERDCLKNNRLGTNFDATKVEAINSAKGISSSTEGKKQSTAEPYKFEGQTQEQQGNENLTTLEIVDLNNIYLLRGGGNSTGHKYNQLVEPTPTIIRLGGQRDQTDFLIACTVTAVAFVGGCACLGWVFGSLIERFRKK